MPRTLPFVLLAAAAACTEPPPQRDGDVGRRPPSSFTPLIDPATFAPGGVAALAQPNASRLLDQATFGARPANGVVPPPIDSVEHVMTRSVAGAVVDLLNAPAGSFAPTPARTGVCDGPFDAKTELGAQFFVAALTAPDQLRLAHRLRAAPDPGGVRERHRRGPLDLQLREARRDDALSQPPAVAGPRQLPRPPRGGDDRAGHGRVPQHGQQRRLRDRRHPHHPQRELRPRAAPALHDRHDPARRGRPADPRRQRSAAAGLHRGPGPGLRPHPDRVDLSVDERVSLDRGQEPGPLRRPDAGLRGQPRQPRRPAPDLHRRGQRRPHHRRREPPGPPRRGARQPVLPPEPAAVRGQAAHRPPGHQQPQPGLRPARGRGVQGRRHDRAPARQPARRGARDPDRRRGPGRAGGDQRAPALAGRDDQLPVPHDGHDAVDRPAQEPGRQAQ
jgi:hypothetical protein